jgi:outer membrane protein assembly factor BamB
VGGDGTIYAGDDTNLDAITPDGTIKWQVPLVEPALGSPTIASDGTIYLTTTEGATHGALSAVSPEGNLLWTSPEDRAGSSSSPAILPDGTLVTMQVAVWVGSVNGYRPSDGAHVFSQPHGFVYPYNVFPVVGQDGSFYASTDDGLQGFDGAGQPLAIQLSIGSPGDLPAAVGADGLIYTSAAVGEGWWEVEATRPDGTRAWAVKDVPAQTFAIGTDGTVFASGDQQVYAITRDGTLARTFDDLGSPISSMLALDANDNVLFGTRDGKIHARSR